MTEFFRAGVGIVLRDRPTGRVLVFERGRPPHAWQYPQGGIEDGEEPIDAAWRELGEEAGLSRSTVRFVAALDRWTTYELPAELRSAKTGRGQTQRWHLFDLLADPAGAIVFDRTTTPEFRAWRWTTPSGAATDAAPFRQSVYEQIADWLEGAPTDG